MKDSARIRRQAEIEAAAYAILDAKGSDGLTMQALAKEARASIETLYRWYGDRTGLFAALVARNTADVVALLSGDPERQESAMDTLAQIGPRLLTMLLSERAIALNRAAAGDPTGALGRALAEAGRDTIAPLIVQVIEKAVQDNALAHAPIAEMSEAYLALLIGDLQIRRASRAMPEPPDAATIETRASRATEALKTLYAPGLDAAPPSA